jgi:hypothetical protein
LKLQTGKTCKKGQKAVAWNQQGVAGPKGAMGPSGIAGLNGAPVPSATNAATANSATTAQTANNALALGGIPASGFTRSDCASTTGQIKGFAVVPTEPEPGFNFEPVSPSYNCSGQSVEAKKESFGGYLVRFSGNPAEIAMATAIFEGQDSASPTVSVQLKAPGEWVVVVSDKEGHLVKNAFELLVP